MAVIVIEGIDGAGKSTLVERIKAQIPKDYDTVFVAKGVPVFDDPALEYEKHLTWLRPNHFAVFDRFYVGELLYGPLYRGFSNVAGRWQERLDEHLDILGAIKVILLPPREVCRERAYSRGEDYLKPEHFDQIWDGYRDFAANNPSWLIIQDNSDETAVELVRKAIRKA